MKRYQNNDYVRVYKKIYKIVRSLVQLHIQGKGKETGPRWTVEVEEIKDDNQAVDER